MNLMESMLRWPEAHKIIGEAQDLIAIEGEPKVTSIFGYEFVGHVNTFIVKPLDEFIAQFITEMWNKVDLKRTPSGGIASWSMKDPLPSTPATPTQTTSTPEQEERAVTPRGARNFSSNAPTGSGNLPEFKSQRFHGKVTDMVMDAVNFPPAPARTAFRVELVPIKVYQKEHDQYGVSWKMTCRTHPTSDGKYYLVNCTIPKDLLSHVNGKPSDLLDKSYQLSFKRIRKATRENGKKSGMIFGSYPKFIAEVPRLHQYSEELGR